MTIDTRLKQGEIGRGAAVIAECRLLATMSEEPNRTTRRFLTPPVAEVHAHLRGRMEALGMTVVVDAIGNLRGLWSPVGCDPARLILGSHIDTVPDAGAFDGVLGVVVAIEWVRLAQELNYRRAIEVIAFSEEEGVRFGVPFLGSRAVVGSFDPQLLSLKDENGFRMDEVIRSFRLDPGQIREAALNDDVMAFIEIHIEQGPVLDTEGLQFAVVEGVVGQSRLSFRFSGQANHAGTTPMHLRQDALMAAAEWMLAVEQQAKAVNGLVATCGKIRVGPNTANVVPGDVELSLDVRHASDWQRLHAVQGFTDLAVTIAERRGIGLQWASSMNQSAVAMDRRMSDQLLRAVVATRRPGRRLWSGAGHDSVIMASRFPTAMLFLRTPGGISHHPEESVLEEDVEAALCVGEQFLSYAGCI